MSVPASQREQEEEGELGGEEGEVQFGQLHTRRHSSPPIDRSASNTHCSCTIIYMHMYMYDCLSIMSITLFN